MIMNENLYSDCKTGEECHQRFLYLKDLEAYDIYQEEQAYNNFCINKLMAHYKMSYKEAEREFLRYGMMRMGMGL